MGVIRYQINGAGLQSGSEYRAVERVLSNAVPRRGGFNQMGSAYHAIPRQDRQSATEAEFLGDHPFHLVKHSVLT
jgi:hypothetical protein